MSSERFKLAWRRLVAYSGHQWVRCLLLVLFGAGVHVPALQGPLLWDDLYLARDNPFIKSPLLILEAFRHYLFPDAFAGHYRPIQTISYVFDYLIWNTDAYGYHLSNLLWHVGSGILLYLLLQRLLRSAAPRCLGQDPGGAQNQHGGILSAAAFLIALLWMVHPVHSAAVDYISGRADSLTFFFACGAWLIYLRAREVSRNILRRSCYVLAALTGLVALCSRETGLVWMGVFLLHLFLFDRKPTAKAKLIVLFCCFAVVGAYGTLRALPEYRPPPHDTSATPTAAAKSILMLRALGDYGRLMIWPANLHMERDVVNIDSLQSTTHWKQFIQGEYLSIAGLLVVAALLFGASRKGPAQPIRILGATWFVLTYLPISNLFNLNANVAEHWLYLPSVGFLMFLAGCCLDFPQLGRQIALAITCAAVLGLSTRSFVRSSDWVTAETFYRRTLLAGGVSVRMCVNLASIYSKRGENAKAETILRKVLRADPTYLVARNNLAAILVGRGEKAEAKEMFDSVQPTPMDRANYPRTWTARLNLARMAHARDDDQTALTVIDEALRDYPGTWELARYKAELLRKTSGAEAALPIMEEFARDHSWHCEAFIALGRMFWESGDAARAEKAFRHASWLDVHDAEALSALALLMVQQNRLEDAFETQSRAVTRQPDEIRPRLLLSDILEKMGRTAEARAATAQVDHLRTLAQAEPAAN
jgi:tetratricopeptide (TPR) repeat protein